MTQPDAPPMSSGLTDQDARDTNLWRGSVWALLTVATVSLGGFAFWVLAATTSPNNEHVGIATAWYTLLQLGVSVSAIGLPILITRRGSVANANQLTGAALLTTAFVGLIVGSFAPALAGASWETLSGRSSISLVPFFALGAIGTGLTLGVDARLMSLRRWRAVFLRGTVPVAIRIPLVFLDPLQDRATWLVILIIAPLAVSGFVTTGWLIIRGEIVLSRPSILNRTDRTFFASQHIAALATQAPYFLVPFLVSRQVSGTLNAAFYLVWGIGLMVAMIPQTLAQVLLSETSLAADSRSQRVRATLTANVALGVVAWAGSLFLARPVLELVGPAYADIAHILPWLLLAALAWGVTSICLTEARLSNDARTTNLITWTLAVGTIGGCIFVLPGRPIWGATIVWLCANMTTMAIGIIALDRRRKPASSTSATYAAGRSNERGTTDQDPDKQQTTTQQHTNSKVSNPARRLTESGSANG